MSATVRSHNAILQVQKGFLYSLELVDREIRARW
jgi:hypothetical protein